jgi:cell pole-organizing protein PopZ
MSDNNAPEPTMEEILASIRRIISEDEPAATPSSEATTASPPHGDPEMDDVLELTEPLDAPAPAPEPAYAAPEPASEFETSGDLDIYSRSEAPAPAPVAASAPSYASSYIEEDEDQALVGAPAAQSASSAFGQLSRTVSMPADGRSLEDVVRELLRPLLRDWLDTNLPAIVEKAVQLEVERIARRR